MFPNLFTLMKTDHSEWPESQLLNPIYKLDPKIEQENPFYPKYDQDVERRFDFCSYNPSQYGCPPAAMMEDIISTCRWNKWCIYDYFFLQNKLLATLLTENF